MKKIKLLVAFIATSSLAFSQALHKTPDFEQIKKADKILNSNSNTTKALGTSIWSSDFSTPSAWTLGGTGNQGTWVIGSTALLPNSPLYYSAIQSTTVANGIAFFAGIDYLLNGTVDSQNAWIEMTNSIDCSSENTVTLNFEQAYRAFNSDQTLVEVSLDGGTTWQQTVDINPNITANNSATETVVSRNFNVNQSSTVKFRFRWENTSTLPTGSGYAWQIDDVDVTTLADHDIAVSNNLYGTTAGSNFLYYHQIPLAQVAGIESSAVITNQGSQSQPNVTFNVTESVNGTFSASSAPTTLASGAGDSLVASPSFTPGSIGDYQLDYSISYNNTDDIPSNNVIEPYKFEVGTSIFARDSSTVAETGVVYGEMTGANRTPATSFQAGNMHVMNVNASLTGIDFQFGNLISPGGVVFGEILDGNLDPITNGETLPYTVAAGDEGSYQTLAFSSPITLVAGETYIVTVKSFDIDFSVATAGKSPIQTTFIYYNSDATWYYTTTTPIVRMNFGPILSSSKSSISNLVHIVGTPSVADSFNVSGSNLSNDIIVSAPTNFEISKQLAGPYSSTLTYVNTGTAVTSSKVYVRLDGPVENLSQAGNIVISTTGSNDKLVALTGKTYAECDIDVTTAVSALTISANATGLTYQWFDCDSNSEIMGETGQTYTATANGNYSVIITEGPCVDTSACVQINNVNLMDNEFAGVSVFPNPVKDVLKVTSENSLLESIDIVSATGSLVYSSTISSNNFEINTSNLSNGVYFVNLRTEKSVKTFKVVK